MQTETIISLLIAFGALLFTAFSFRRNAMKDNSGDARELATMAANIQYIRTSIDDIKLENKAIQRDMSEMKEKVAAIDQSAKSAHRRIDDLMQKG